ncbi:PAP2 superfamily-domain-containing protein [Hypoxylon argillaceum]|nr:PAP2 superfamily-domain-containing protein [Hypoxylon argillaceum]
MDQQPRSPGPVRSSTISTTRASPRPPSNANSKARRLSSTCFTRDSYVVEKRPTFGQWIKVTWLDILTVFIVGACVFPVYYLASPLGIRVFPLDVRMSETNSTSTSTPVSIIPLSFAYPARRQMVSNWLIAIVAIAFPTIVILLMQLRIRCFWDLNNALLGFTYALLTSAAFQGTTKAFIGGLRPNFYDVCQPDSEHAKNEGNKTGLNGIGFRKDMWTIDVCTSTDVGKLRNAMQGFPSGHSTTMVAAMLYLCLYINAKLKVFANYHTPLWKLIALVVPMLGTVLLCGTIIIDNTHSWYDVAGGATIGALIASAAFRMVYPSLFDWRINHIPLSRSVPFDGYQRSDLVATARAGWRSPAREQSDASSSPNGGHAGPESEHGIGPGTANRTAS